MAGSGRKLYPRVLTVLYSLLFFIFRKNEGMNALHLELVSVD